jgi:hypothetical protein
MIGIVRLHGIPLFHLRIYLAMVDGRAVAPDAPAMLSMISVATKDIAVDVWAMASQPDPQQQFSVSHMAREGSTNV